MKNITIVLLFLGFQNLLFTQNSDSISNQIKEKSHSIVLNETLQYDVESINALRIKKKFKILVLNKKGLSGIKAFERYDLDTKIVSMEAKIFDNSGNELEHFKKSDFNKCHIHSPKKFHL